MAESILEHLRKPNVSLMRHGTRTTPTFNASWDPVDNILPWDDFTYGNLTRRYARELSSTISFPNPSANYGAANLNKLYSERSLDCVLAATNMYIVSYCLPPSQFISDSARTVEELDINPDWGAGDDSLRSNRIGRTKALLFGDTKYLWRYNDAISLVRRYPNGGYMEQVNPDLVAPFEQVQHYGRKNNTCYQFIITEEGLVAVRLRLSPEPTKTSPRPKRMTTTQGHRRLTSSSTISDITTSLSDMSVDSKDLLPSISALEVSVVPWNGRADGMTVNLALWFLVKLASEDNALRHDYISLETGRIPVQPSNPSYRSVGGPARQTGSLPTRTGGAVTPGTAVTVDKGKRKAVSDEQASRIGGGSLPRKRSQILAPEASEYTDVGTLKLISGCYAYTINGKSQAKVTTDWVLIDGYLCHQELRVKGRLPGQAPPTGAPIAAPPSAAPPAAAASTVKTPVSSGGGAAAASKYTDVGTLKLVNNCYTYTINGEIQAKVTTDWVPIDGYLCHQKLRIKGRLLEKAPPTGAPSVAGKKM